MSFSENLGQMRQLSEVQIPGFPVFEGNAEDRGLDARLFADYFREAVDIAEKRNVMLYCGEYGVINLASPEDTLKWYQAIHGAFEEYGIGRAAWSYKEMDFGLVDDHMKSVFDEMLQII